MIYELCFTCGKDGALATSTHRARAGVKSIWVVDTPDAAMVPPPGVELWVIAFFRDGNLNGWACLAGMCAAYRRAFEAGATAVIKRDSDTIVLDVAMLTDFSFGMLAIGAYQQGRNSDGQPWRLFGCCYALAPGALDILERGVRERDHPSPRPPDDVVFSWFLRGFSRVYPWTAIRFTKNRDHPPGVQFAENTGNLWILDATNHRTREVRHMF